MNWLSHIADLIDRLISGPGSQSTHAPSGTTEQGLRQVWLSWLEMKSSGTGLGSHDEPDVVALDRRLTEIFADYFQSQRLASEDREALSGYSRKLKVMVPALKGEGRQYYAMAAAVARGILDETDT